MPASYAPIPETQIGGVAYLFGILNNGSQIAITGIAGMELDSDDLTATWEEKQNTDTTGFVQNICEYNQKIDRTIKFMPSGSNRANAHAVADATMVLLTLVVSGFKVNTANGTWRVKPGTKLSLKMAENATIDIPCEKYINTSQNAALTGAPISG